MTELYSRSLSKTQTQMLSRPFDPLVCLNWETSRRWKEGQEGAMSTPPSHVSAALSTTMENGRNVPDYGKRTESRIQSCREANWVWGPVAKEASLKISLWAPGNLLEFKAGLNSKQLHSDALLLNTMSPSVFQQHQNLLS